jgi:cobalamin transport system substrate-binding protein
MTLRGGGVMPTQTGLLPTERAATRAPVTSRRLRFVLIAALMTAPGCSPAPPMATASPRRVVALAPSVTEIVYGLDEGDRLVGVCGQCDYPPATRDLPRVGGYLAPSVEEVLAVRPDLVLVVPSPGNREAVRTLERAGVRILVTADRTLDDLWRAIDSIAAALGLPERGAALRASVQQQLDAVRNRVAGLPPTRVLLVVGHRPLIVAGGGTLQDELLRVAGGINVAADAGAAFPQVPIELVVARAPEVILDAAMGSEAGGQELFEELRTVPAVRDGRIVPLAADAIFRAGPRVGEAAALLAGAIHPGAAAGS